MSETWHQGSAFPVTNNAPIWICLRETDLTTNTTTDTNYPGMITAANGHYDISVMLSLSESVSFHDYLTSNAGVTNRQIIAWKIMYRPRIPSNN